jgi:hypothetical protein
MRMIDALLQVAPNVTKQFLDNLLFTYGVTPKDFETKDIIKRYIEVKRYFGYSMDLPTDKSIADIQKEIKFIFEGYELLMQKFPFGIPDPMKNLKEMSNIEKEKYFDEHYTILINISLCDALVRNNSSNRPSLKDALIARVLSRIEQISAEKARKDAEETKFWNETIKNFDKDEIPPF